MLPCQEHCSQYCQGCHLDCTYWTSFRKNQESQRQLKKQYLSYYGNCAPSGHGNFGNYPL